jgi:hypothetical protein
MSRTATLSARKEALFEQYNRHELSFDDLSRQVYEIDHPTPKWPLRWAKVLITAFLPLLFVGSQRPDARA